MSFEKESIKKMILAIAFISMLFLSIIYLTYSLSNSNISRKVITDTLKVDEEAYGNTIFDSTNLKFSPILDKNATNDSNKTIHIKFNVGASKENTTNSAIYDIALANLNVDCELLSPYIKWKLIKNNEEISTGNLDYKFDTIANGRLILTNIQQNLKEYSDDKNTYDHYDFYMWFSDSCQEENILSCEETEDQTKLLNKTISGRIEVELYGGNKKELERHPSETLDKTTCNVEENKNA